MANYIEKEDFNQEMLKCVKSGVLTNRSIEMFRLLASEVSNKFDFRHYEDKVNAIDNAVGDFASNWSGYKWQPVFSVNLVRNFKDGDKIIIQTEGMKKISVTAKTKTNFYDQFLIGETDNKSLQNLATVIEKVSSGKITCSLHKVTKKITFVDAVNEIGVFGKVELISKINQHFYDKGNGELHVVKNFGTPPPAFNWCTSVAINGIIKFMDKMYPKEWRGKIITFSEMTNDEGNLFAI